MNPSDAANAKWQKAQGTQTGYPSPPGSNSMASAGTAAAQDGGSRGTQSQQPGTPKKSAHRATREYALAARERKRQTEAHNLQYPPRPEDIWICEFCEYERIFGEPPEALIRQYEIKDRRQRQQEEERRRLLEKAKARGRKGKKGVKAATASKNATAAQDRAQQPHAGPQTAPMSNEHSQGTQSEEYYEEDYDEEEDEGDDHHDGLHDEMPPLQSQLAGGPPPGGIGVVGGVGLAQGQGHGQAVV